MHRFRGGESMAAGGWGKAIGRRLRWLWAFARCGLGLKPIV